MIESFHISVVLPGGTEENRKGHVDCGKLVRRERIQKVLDIGRDDCFLHFSTQGIFCCYLYEREELGGLVEGGIITGI
jgi:hypothetical protein